MEQKVLVTKAALPPMEEYIEEIRSIWDTHWLTNMGEKHKELQKQLKDYLDVDHIELTVNGHMALELVIQAMDLSGEVITTPFTFASTTHAIVRNNLLPVFCDIRTDNYTIDADQIERLITERTTAIVPVHVYGNVCDMEKIQKIAERYGLKVIYDAAHTFGVKYQGIGIGNFGDASCFSFHATKVFNTIEGGAVCYRQQEIGEKLYNLKNFGIRGEERVVGVGANAKMNEFQAAMGLCNLRHLSDNLKKRQAIVKQYQDRLSNISGLTIWREQQDVTSNYAYFPILIDAGRFGISRDRLYERLAKDNIYTRKYFYPLTNTFECFEGAFDVNKTPAALEISKKVLTLPLYPDLTAKIVDDICDVIEKSKKEI